MGGRPYEVYVARQAWTAADGTRNRVDHGNMKTDRIQASKYLSKQGMYAGIQSIIRIII